MPAGFQFLDGAVSAWIPAAFSPDELRKGANYLKVVARLAARRDHCTCTGQPRHDLRTAPWNIPRRGSTEADGPRAASGAGGRKRAASADRAADRGGCGDAHRVRQRRESSAGPRGRAPARDCPARLSGREPRPYRAATADRKSAPLGARTCRRRGARKVGAGVSRTARAARHDALCTPGTRSANTGIHGARVAGGGRAVWPGAGHARDEAGCRLDPERQRTRRLGGGIASRRACRRRGGHDAGAARRRGPSHPDALPASLRRHRVPSGAGAHASYDAPVGEIRDPCTAHAVLRRGAGACRAFAGCSGSRLHDVGTAGVEGRRRPASSPRDTRWIPR